MLQSGSQELMGSPNVPLGPSAVDLVVGPKFGIAASMRWLPDTSLIPLAIEMVTEVEIRWRLKN